MPSGRDSFRRNRVAPSGHYNILVWTLARSLRGIEIDKAGTASPIVVQCCSAHLGRLLVKKRLLVMLAATFLMQALALRQTLRAETPNPARASEEKIVKARPLPLNSVRLMGGSLKNAQDLDAKYL